MAITLPNGYTMETTFFMDFGIAEAFGKDAVIETFNNAFKNWKTNYIYLTELAIVMSNKACMWYGKDNDMSLAYTELYHKIDDYCMNNLKNDALAFYIKVTD